MVPDGRPAVAAGTEPTPADITGGGEIVMIAIEIIDPRTMRAGAHERVEIRAPRKQHPTAAGRLVSVIASDNTRITLKVIRLPDTGVQHQVNVTENVSRENDQIRRLYQLTTARIDIGRAGGALTCRVQIDPQHSRSRPYLEIRIAVRKRYHREMRTGLRIHLTSVAGAKSTVMTRPIRNPVWIDIRAGGVRGRGGKRVIPEISRRLLEQQHVVRRRQRGIRILISARRLEDVAAVDAPAFEVAGLARGPAQLLEAVVVGFQLGVIDGPILQVHILRDDLAPIPGHGVGIHPMLPLSPAPLQSGPVSAPTAHT